MKKFFFLIFCLLVLTGCSSTVKINIDKDKVDEEVSILANNSNEYNEIKKWSGFPLTMYYDQELSNPFGNSKEDGVPYYKTDFNDSLKKASISASFSINSHNRSSLIKGCFKHYNVIKNGNEMIFSTSNGLICKFTDFNVVVTTPYKVLSNNASVTDSNTNTYTWKFNNSNSSNLGIYMEIDFSKKFNQSENKSSNGEKETKNSDISTIIFVIISVVVGVSIFVGYLILKNKKDEVSGF